MDEVAKFWDKVARMIKDQDKTILTGTVASVDENARTCTMQTGGVKYEDVRLYSVVKPDLKGFCFIPKIGSPILAARIGGSNELYVAMFSEIDKLILTIGDVLKQVTDKSSHTLKIDTTTLKATDKGLTLARGGSGLLKTLEDLIDAILALTVTTGVGPSGTPINAATFTQIKQDLKNYLEG